MNLRLELTRLLSLAYVLSSSFMFWMGLSLITDCHSPIVVVLSGSMEPAFQRGDILFLWNKNKVNNVGDVVVYEVSGKSIPIVHRVIKQHQDETTGEQLLLTKGDNNHGDDVPLYTRGKYYLNKKKDVVGTVKGYLPQLGYVTIWISENKFAKFGLLGVLMLSSLISNES